MIYDPYKYRLLCLDPGTDTMGSALLEIDVRVGDIVVAYGATWHASRRYDPNSDVAFNYGTRLARINEQRRVVTTLLEMHQPNGIACEVPFVGKFKQAGMALSELYSAIQLSVFDYSPSISFLGVDNRAAKKAVGIQSSKVKKEDVRKAILSLINLVMSNNIDLNSLDEHTLDAIAVGCYAAELMNAEWRGLDAHRTTCSEARHVHK